MHTFISYRMGSYFSESMDDIDELFKPLGMSALADG